MHTNNFNERVADRMESITVSLGLSAADVTRIVYALQLRRMSDRDLVLAIHLWRSVGLAIQSANDVPIAELRAVEELHANLRDELQSARYKLWICEELELLGVPPGTIAYLVADHLPRVEPADPLEPFAFDGPFRGQVRAAARRIVAKFWPDYPLPADPDQQRSPPHAGGAA